MDSATVNIPKRWVYLNIYKKLNKNIEHLKYFKTHDVSYMSNARIVPDREKRFSFLEMQIRSRSVH